MLSQKFGVTERSIRNYLDTIESILKEQGLQDCFYQKSGSVILSLSPQQEDQLNDYLNEIDFYTYKLSLEERILVITFLLLTNTSYVTLDMLSELMCVSKSTVLNDVKMVMNNLAVEGVKINEQKIRGYSLEIDEMTRRDLILNILEKNNVFSSEFPSNSGNLFIQFVVKHYLKMDMYFRSVQAAIYVSANHYKIIVPDNMFRKLIFTVCLVLARCLEGNTLDAYKSQDEDLAYEIANQIIELSYGGQLKKNDLEYIADKVRVLISSCLMESGEKDNINYYFVVKSFLNRIAFICHESFNLDAKLQEFLTKHLYQIHNRLINNESLVNPYKEDIFERYSNYYQIIKDNINIIEDILNFKLSDDEISFILMHVLAAIERISMNRPVYDIAVVCDTGFGTSSFLVERLKKYYHFNVVEITSSRHFIASLFKNKLNDLNYDFVLSTVNLGDIPVNWVQVSPMLTDNDIDKINTLLEEVYLRKQSEIEEQYTNDLSSVGEIKKPLADRLKTYLPKENIQLDIISEDWKTSIEMTAKPLIRSGIITSQYVEDIYNNVLNNGPYFVLTKGVAIAHSYSESGVKEFGISFARFSNDIHFNSENDPVRLVLVIAILKSEDVKDILFQLMNTLCNEEIKQELLHVTSYEDVIKCLNS